MIKKKPVKQLTEGDGPTTLTQTVKLSADQIDKLLSSMPLLYLARYEHERKKMSEFILMVIESEGDYNTMNASTKGMQTESGKRRSITDIYRLCKYYYPRLTNIRTISRIIGRLAEEKRIGSEGD